MAGTLVEVIWKPTKDDWSRTFCHFDTESVSKNNATFNS